MNNINDINVLIWDVDGTLYQLSEPLSHDVLEAEYRTIEAHKGWDRMKTEEEFNDVHNKITPSATEAVAIICQMTTAQAAVETERYMDRLKYLSFDPKLVALFEELRGFRHFILGNGVRKNIREALKVLGVPLNTFEEIVTSEIVGVNKPHEEGYRYILEKTGMPASEHLMIGDREIVDLMPAKTVGMRTCLVWSFKPSMVADVTTPSVYDLGGAISRL